MAKTYPIQRSFSAGEISPDMIARTDLQGYNYSAAEMLNMVPSIQGPASDRPGFQHIGNADRAEELYCRMIPFHISFDESYVVIITPVTIYVADRDGFQLSNNKFENSDFSDGQLGWNKVEGGGARVRFPAGTCKLNPTTNNPAAVNQQVSATAGEGNLHWVGFAGLDNNPCRIMVGTTPGGNDIADQLFNSEDGGLYFTPNIEFFYIQFQAENNQTKILDTVAVVDTVTGLEFVKFPSPFFTPEIIEQIQVATVPGQGLMYLFQRDTAPQYIDYVSEHQWSIGQLSFIDPVPWGSSYPGSAAFFKGRLYVGGTNTDKVGVWASKPGLYTDFVLPTGTPTESDAMYLPIDTDGDITYLVGGKALHVGMNTGEHIIFGEGQVVPTPANVNTEQQSAYGSARVQAKKVGEQVAFTTPDRRKLYLTTYSRDDVGWISEDVSFAAEHITKGLLRDIAVSTTPFNVLWFPTLDGKLVGMTYDPRRKITGWHRHDTQGRIISATTIKSRGIDELWIGVIRMMDGVEQLMFEQGDPEYKMDSYYEQNAGVPGTVFSGYEHLEGLMVQVLADGAVHPDVMVGVNGVAGEIVLQYPATRVVAGLGYDSVLKTLPVETLQSGMPTTSYEKSWIKVFVRLVDSSIPLVNGIRPPIREPGSPMDLRQANDTQDVEVPLTGWDLYGSIEIKQDLPLHLKVAGLFGELSVETI